MTLPHDLQNLSVHGPKWFQDAIGQPRTEGTVDVAGCPIHYFEWGDPSKRGVVMAHGFLAHARCFAFIAPLLADEFHLVAYDLSGMGDSGARESYPDDVRAAEMLAVAQATGMTDHECPPFVATHSFGSSIGIKACNNHAEAFGGLAVCDFMMMRPQAMRAHMGQSRMRSRVSNNRPNKVYPTLEIALSRYRLAPEQPCNNDFLLQYMAYHSLKEVDGGWSWKFDTSIFSSDNREIDWWETHPQNFVNLPGRKAIIHGAESILFTSDSAAYIQEISDRPVPIISIANAQHHLMLDQPIAFAAALRSVLTMWDSEDRS